MVLTRLPLYIPVYICFHGLVCVFYTFVENMIQFVFMNKRTGLFMVVVNIHIFSFLFYGRRPLL